MRLSVPIPATLVFLIATALILLLLLVRTNATLAATRDQLSASQSRVEQLSVELGASTERVANQEAQNEMLTGDLDTANEQLANSMEQNAGLRSELEMQLEQLTAQAGENETLSANLLETTRELGSKTIESEALSSDLDRVTGLLTGKSSDFESLLKEVGSLEALRADRDSLRGEMDSLRASIKELEDLRRPLMVQSSTVGFRCTGSMEPKITCLDSATWLHNFKPLDIAIGSVIVFTPTPDCEIGLGTTSHRVIDIRTVGGAYFFWTKGDANPDVDGCWIPASSIHGYMIELHKDTHPENSDLRSLVNTAKAERDEAFERYQAAEVSYNHTYSEYCGHNPDACSLDSARVAELDSLYDEYIRLFNLYQEAYEAWNTVYLEASNIL